jgi:hypothetical protein
VAVQLPVSAMCDTGSVLQRSTVEMNRKQAQNDVGIVQPLHTNAVVPVISSKFYRNNDINLGQDATPQGWAHRSSRYAVASVIPCFSHSASVVSSLYRSVDRRNG